MKLSLALLALFANSAQAFAPSINSNAGRHATTQLFVDSSQAIQDALAAAKEFGPSSPEARSAWDIVEEMDASTR